MKVDKKTHLSGREIQSIHYISRHDVLITFSALSIHALLKMPLSRWSMLIKCFRLEKKWVIGPKKYWFCGKSLLVDKLV